MKIKLSKKAKAIVTITVIAAVVCIGLLLDNINCDEFVIENIADNAEDSIMPDSVEVTEDTRIKDGKININEADAELLQQVEGIGASTAEKIVEYREKSGKFTSVDDLINVSGIGDKKLEAMRDFICVE